MPAAARAAPAPHSIWQRLPLASGAVRTESTHRHTDTQRHTHSSPQSPQPLPVLNQPHILASCREQPARLPCSLAVALCPPRPEEPGTDAGWLSPPLPRPVLRLWGETSKSCLGAGVVSPCSPGTCLEGVAEHTGIYKRSQ